MTARDAGQEPTAPPPDGTKATTGAPASSSVSPVIQAFLLQIQEFGLSAFNHAGTDGADEIDVWSNSVVTAGGGDDVVRAWSQSAVDGGDGDDHINVWSDSAVDGGAGNDVITAWSGSRVDGGDGDDRIDVWSNSRVDGGAGNDIISAWSDSIVDGDAGDDRISAWSGSRVSGGAGNDIISASSDSVVDGGTGDDTIWIGDRSIMTYAAGDGKDTITAHGNITLQIGNGLSADQTTVTVSGNEAKISFGNGTDEITLRLSRSSSAQLAFADGRTIEVKPDPAAVASNGFSSGAQLISLSKTA